MESVDISIDRFVVFGVERAQEPARVARTEPAEWVDRLVGVAERLDGNVRAPVPAVDPARPDHGGTEAALGSPIRLLV